MKKIIKQTAVGVLAASAVVLSGCGGSGSGSGETAATGFLSLSVSDGPIRSAEKVCITFNEIELKSGSETTIIIRDPDLDPPWKINLLDYQGTDAAPLLFDKKVPAGDYQWMRLGIDAVQGTSSGVGDVPMSGQCEGTASYIVIDGAIFNLYVPSSENTGLKLVSGFTVPANGSASFTAEWDLGKSITAPPGLDQDVKMKPVIRLVNNVEVGTLTGTVHDDLANTDVCDDPWVHVFDDTVELLNADDSIAMAMVKPQENGDGSRTWNYTVGFLLAGDYKAAFTCNNADFEPADGLEAPITAGVTTPVNF